MPFVATWMDLEIIILSEVRQKKTNIICYHLYVESKKMTQMNIFAKRKTLTGLENKLCSSKRKGGGN